MTVFRYVDTAAAASGDGTTRNHSGATCAYDSLANAEADIDLDWASIAAVGDDLTVKCAGSTADTTAVTWNALGSDGTYTLTIMGDDGAADPGGDDAAQYDDDGRYEGPLDWSTSHYRLEGTGYGVLPIYVAACKIFGIQVRNTNSSGGRQTIRTFTPSPVDPTGHLIIDSCRSHSNPYASASCFGIYIDTAGRHHADYIVTVQNCISVANSTGDGRPLTFFTQDGWAGTLNAYNNTCYGNAGVSSYGIYMLKVGTPTGTLNIANNVSAATADDIRHDPAHTVNYYNNASDDADEGGGAIALGAHADEWVDPTGSSPGDFDFTPKSGGQLIGAADLTYAPALDISGATRSTAAPDIGAIEAASNNVPSPLSLLTTGVG